MKIETLLERIDKAEKKIVKVKGTIERHNKRLDKIKNSLISKGIDLNQYDKYSESIRGTDLYWDLCDYEDKLEAIESNKKKLKETEETLKKLNNLLAVEKEKKDNINNVIPKCVLDYLEIWKLKAKDHLIDIANEYIELYNKEYDVTEKELKALYEYKYVKDDTTGKRVRELCRLYSDEKIKDILENQNSYDIREAKNKISRRYRQLFENKYTQSDLSIISKIVEYYEYINMEKLDNILNDEVEAKKEMFVNRVSAIVGIIKDMKDFNIGANGEINGIAIGDKTKAKVTTIIAGGYNIQCEHFRVLVNEIK